MNRLLYIVYRYSLMWRYSFNVDKTEYLIWGTDNEPNVDVIFGNDVIIPSDECKHMGLKLCTKPSGILDMIETRAGKVRTVLSSAQGLGDCLINVPPLSMSKIYWSVGVPKLTYGLDVTHIDDRCMDKLENIHRQNAKLVQSLPSNVHTPAPLATIGWISMFAHVAVLKIMFLCRTLCLGDSVYRRLLVIRLNMLRNNPDAEERFTSPTLSCWKFARIYKLDDVVLSFIENGDSKRIESTKRIVKSRVKEVEKLRWRYSCMFYADLDIYLDVVNDIKPIVWWSFVQSFPTYHRKAAAVVSILMGGQPKGLQCNFASTLCRLCISRECDDPIHTLFVCDALQEERNIIAQPLINSMPQPMLASYCDLSNEGKLRFFVSGVAKEYSSVMKCIADYIFALYQKRKLIYDSD